jgi:hypothetical protein
MLDIYNMTQGARYQGRGVWACSALVSHTWSEAFVMRDSRGVLRVAFDSPAYGWHVLTDDMRAYPCVRDALAALLAADRVLA